VAETTLPCPLCHETFPVKLTFGEFEALAFPCRCVTPTW